MAPISSEDLAYELAHLAETLPGEPAIVYAFGSAMAEHAAQLPLSPTGFVVGALLAEMDLQRLRKSPSPTATSEDWLDFTKTLAILPTQIPRIAKAFFDEAFAREVARGMVQAKTAELRHEP